jgi:hypothetical protein
VERAVGTAGAKTGTLSRAYHFSGQFGFKRRRSFKLLRLFETSPRMVGATVLVLIVNHPCNQWWT